MRLSEVADGGTREASATPAYQLHAVLPRRFPHPPSPTPHFSGSGGSTPPPPLTEVTASALVSPPRTTCLFSFVLLDATSNKWVIAQLRNLHRLPTALRTRARCCSSRARLALQLLPNPPPTHTHTHPVSRALRCPGCLWAGCACTQTPFAPLPGYRAASLNPSLPELRQHGAFDSAGLFWNPNQEARPERCFLVTVTLL